MVPITWEACSSLVATQRTSWCMSCSELALYNSEIWTTDFRMVCASSIIALTRRSSVKIPQGTWQWKRQDAAGIAAAAMRGRVIARTVDASIPSRGLYGARRGVV
eukprot:CAMPEP_0171089796 /NCGR_PEP_ID=MMETSP0766_2-20121228/27342_1 /TAXON_ID=439317 /ORGANISM="Gambierdiscus australes, Strain CAWD 149" /LENGTH=104 /DNA_ID=CAMNT_0011547707 /DNA_START=260 /DNA_END=574 /DNA_ORIENTATION=+